MYLINNLGGLMVQPFCVPTLEYSQKGRNIVYWGHCD